MIERALSVDPRLRYQSAHELSRDVQVILKVARHGELAVRLPSVASPPVVRDLAWSDVRRWIYIAATAIAVVTIAGVTTSAVFNRGLGRLEFAPEPLFSKSTGACGR